MKQPLYNQVAQRRQTLGLTQAELAEQVGVSRQTIISIEKGHYEPSVRLALGLARILGCSVETLFYY